MWILFTAFSLVFTVAHIGHRASKGKGSALLLVLSLLFVIFNLLSIYIQIAEWIRYQDWSALEDVSLCTVCCPYKSFFIPWK